MPASKRSAPSEESTGTRRRSARLSGTQVKSAYFEASSEEEGKEASGRRKRESRTKKRARKAESESDEGQHKEESEDEVQVQPMKRSRGRPAKKAKGEPDEDQYSNAPEDEADEDDGGEEDDDDGPRKVEIIPLEKLRDTGGVAYEDHKVHKNTMLFLRDLKANNKRTWLKSHDGEYRRALKDWQSFVETTTQTLIEVDDTIPELPAKDVIFRIHRDIRFSKDPTPYKPHFSAAWSRTGRKGPYAVYYVHCEPKSTFIGGGLWHPEAAYVTKLRASIDERPRRWRRALNDPLFKKAFFPTLKAKDGVEGVVKAFVGKNQENALKKKPMGYEVTHRDIELLKLRNYTVGTKIDDDVLCGDDAQAQIRETLRGLFGFVTFLNSIVMPDPNLDDDESDDEEEGEGGEGEHSGGQAEGDDVDDDDEDE
ncbi:glycoside hydrolase family 92 [Trichoderma cornu-damae]|uniref:Glycoside hydrolase family 92 n=1 Tax=Trichoderma cornu-damae TaxID=654480 RepID=A0A9P8QQL6_9HYPO|nr:glycoside hydrolase family 92 [Trichoderma cornu-damae]